MFKQIHNIYMSNFVTWKTNYLILHLNFTLYYCLHPTTYIMMIVLSSICK